MGCFWTDYGAHTPVKNVIIDEIAAINDSIPIEMGSRVRMKIVRNWVRNRAESLGVHLS
jgi:hypothetical protein